MSPVEYRASSLAVDNFIANASSPVRAGHLDVLCMEAIMTWFVAGCFDADTGTLKWSSMDSLRTAMREYAEHHASSNTADRAAPRDDELQHMVTALVNSGLLVERHPTVTTMA